MRVSGRDDAMTPAPLDRRVVLQGGAAVAALTAADLAVGPLRFAAARSGPTQADWNALQRDIDGKVVQRGDNGFKKAHQLFDPRFDGLHPLAVVECTSAADVATAVQFAKKQSLPIRPKAGGHSYVGASSRKGGMVIDVSRIVQTTYDASSKIATIGAGKQLYNAHNALAKHSRTIPTGTCPTVGAAGLTLGGGLGIASRSAGLTSDQLFSARIVPADGVIRTAKAGTNPDLLWALRGGGGGNFGIVTSLTYHTQPTTSLGFFMLSFPWSSAAAVVRGWGRRIKQMEHSTWANLHLEASSDGTAEARIVGVCAPGRQGTEASAMAAQIG